MPKHDLVQALGIPFSVVSASEVRADYRAVFQANNSPDCFEHIFDDVRTQLASGPCLLHPQCASCVALPTGITIMFTGSPCDPFSKQRYKRFADGSVKNHADFLTTFRDVVQMYQKCQPMMGILEQVQGFLSPISSTDPTTPFDQLLGLELVTSWQRDNARPKP